MNLLEMVKYLRVSILDDTGGVGIEWADIEEDQDESMMLRWNNEELTVFINEAIKKVHRSSYLIKDHQASLDISISSSTNTYNLDTRILKVKKARLASSKKELTWIDVADVWDIPEWDEESGTTIAYITDYNTNKISFYPINAAVDTVELISYREELTPLSWDDNEKSPELANRFHIPMLNYVAYLAYLKDEASSLDPGRSTQFLQAFIREFDDNSAYTETRRNRSSGRTIKYGGI